MTDYRALCVELFTAIQLYTGQNPAAAEIPSNELVGRLMDAMAATAAALAQPEPACVACDGSPAPENSPCAVCGAVWAQPEPVAPTDEELNDTYWKAWHEHLDRTNSVLHAAGLRAVLARWGRPAIEPQADGEVAELVAALKNDAECAEAEHCDLLARPEPQGATDAAIEEAAKLIHASMRFAVSDNHYTRDWVERGNSLMQDEARRTARAVLARYGATLRIVKLEEAHQQPEPIGQEENSRQKEQPH